MSDLSVPTRALPLIPSRTLSLLAWLVMVALFAPVIRWLVHVWSSSVYDAYGALVPVMALAMVVSRRNVLARADKQPSGAGLWLTAAGAILLLAALLMDFNLLGGVALMLTLAGLVCGVWGRAVLKIVAFPIGFLLLMLPLNYPLEIFIGFPLRLLSVKLTALLLRCTGLDVTVQGTLIATTHFQVAIESPCSGLKTLSALLMTGLVLAFFLHPRWRDRFVILLLIPPVAVVANAFRNTIITLLGHNYGCDVAMGFLHTFSGLAVFLLAVVLLIIVSELLLWRRIKTSSAA